METLLSCAIDNISSKELTRISKGLRQIRGVLEQICSRSGGNSDDQSPPSLALLEDDLAFREFFRLQERFEWNVATRLVTTLDRLLGMGSVEGSNALMCSGLYLLQGCLILHPPSRSIFERELYMNLLIDLMDPLENPPQILATALSTLMCALLYRPRNIRVFEEVDGLQAVVYLLVHLQSQMKSSSPTTPTVPLFSRGPVGDPSSTTVSLAEVRARLLEFIAFYLWDEPGCDDVPEDPRHRRGSSVHASPTPHSFAAEKQVRSGTEKRRMLAKHFYGMKVDDCITPTSPSPSPVPSSEGVSRGFWKSKIIPSSSSSSSKSSSEGSHRSRDSGFVSSSGNSWGSRRSEDETDSSVTLVSLAGKTGSTGSSVATAMKPKVVIVEPRRSKRENVGGSAILDVLVEEIRRMGVGSPCV